MSQAMQVLSEKSTGALKPAYAALFLGIVTAALFPLPVFATILGLAGLATALYARQAIRKTSFSAGTVPSLLGAVLSSIGIVSCVPWLFAIIMMAFAR
ncbi:hypothetical protein [Rhodoglobus sp.]